YTSNGQLDVATDAKDNETDYDYDGFGRLETITYADNSTEEFEYDAASNLTKFTNRADQEISFTYDALNRLKSKTRPGESAITLVHDIAGRVVEVKQGLADIDMAYDRADRAYEITDQNGYTVEYWHDVMSRREAMRYPDSMDVSYTYDDLGRITHIKDDNDETIAEYIYDDLSRRTTLKYYYNGGTTPIATTTYDYEDKIGNDNLGNRIEGITHDLPGTTNDITLGYTFDKVGNRLTRTYGSEVQMYDYDNLYQLTDVDYNDGQNFDYAYDKVHNRTGLITGTLAEGLVGQWKLDEGSGGVAFDTSVNNNHGTATNGPVWTNDAKINWAMDFDGSDDYIAIADDDSLDFTGAFTVAAWVKTETATGYGYIVFKADTTTVDGYYIGKVNGKWQFVCAVDGTMPYVQSDNAPVADTWTHVLGRRLADGTMELFIDGVKQTYNTASITGTINSTGGLYLGKDVEYQNDYEFDGIIDEVCIYNRDLSDSEVNLLYNTSQTLYNVNSVNQYLDVNLVAHWELEENTGTVASDETENFFDGTIVNASWSASGKIGNCLQFDGTGDYVDFDEFKGISGSSARTTSAWIKCSTGEYAIMQYGTETNNGIWLVSTYQNKLTLTTYGGYIQGTTTITDNQWHHIAVVLEDGDTSTDDVKLYVDGSLETINYASTNAVNTALGHEICVGSWHHDDDSYNFGFTGYIDDVRIYDRGLSAAEVDQLADATAETDNFGLDYDANGNLAHDLLGNTYTYDCENRMTQAVVGSTTWSYGHDLFGRRLSKGDGSTTTTYVYDGTQVIAEYEGVDLKKKYIYGPGIDQPIAMIYVDGYTETWYYYLQDSLGNVIALIDDSGAIVETYEYTPFGTPTIKNASGTEIATSSVDNPYMFTGRRWDAETSTYYYRFRNYCPMLGRFMQNDPLGYADSMNQYAYCVNNPVNYIDPLGLGFLRWARNTAIGAASGAVSGAISGAVVGFCTGGPAGALAGAAAGAIGGAVVGAVAAGAADNVSQATGGGGLSVGQAALLGAAGGITGGVGGALVAAEVTGATYMVTVSATGAVVGGTTAGITSDGDPASIAIGVSVGLLAGPIGVGTAESTLYNILLSIDIELWSIAIGNGMKDECERGTQVNVTIGIQGQDDGPAR
ncbi:MAG: hypothetical protein JEZ07_16665, partial [Phycisphaerae bacterium]|nr:hypothetical protein [Phycisphaerae bacterium]